MNKVNILILMSTLNIGGGEKHVYDLMSYSDKNKFNFIFVCLYELGKIGEEILRRKDNSKIYFNLMKSRFDIRGVLKLIRIMKNEKIDILYMVHTPLTLFWGVLCSMLSGVTISITRSPTTNPTAHVKRRKIVNLITLRFVDKIIAQANSQRNYFINHENVDSEKIEVIYNGVDIKPFKKSVDKTVLMEKIGVSPGSPVVGIVARLAPQKGLKVFLKAAVKVNGVLPDVHFMIVGDGAERGQLEQMSRELSIQHNIHFVGMVKGVSQFISLFNVAVLSSKPVGETFSNAILEYMAAAKPVVATNVGSIAEQVIDGKTGFLIPHEDSDALADSILKILKNRDIAKKMGEEGRKMVQEKFTIEKMIAKYEALFTDLVKQTEDGE